MKTEIVEKRDGYLAEAEPFPALYRHNDGTILFATCDHGDAIEGVALVGFNGTEAGEISDNWSGFIRLPRGAIIKLTQE